MDISIIVPFFKGEKYLSRLLDSIDIASSNLKKEKNMSTELILVNDNPGTKVPIVQSVLNRVIVIENNCNSGIHFSRVKGLEKATGKYIVFLDQDDQLSDFSLVSQIESIGRFDMVIGNGENHFMNGKKQKFYTSESIQKKSTEEKNYYLYRNMIVSPGQVLLLKDSIPVDWINNIMEVNGSDDYFLWLLMFKNKKNITFNQVVVYFHIETGKNISYDLKAMEASNQEMVSKLKNLRKFTNTQIWFLERCIKLKSELLKNKKLFLLKSIFNMDLVIYSMYFRIRYGRLATI